MERYQDKDDSAKKGTNLGKVELSHANPELGVNGFGDDKVKGALANVVRYFEDGSREKVVQ